MEERHCYLTPADVMRLLSAGRSMVYELFNSADFPAIRLGRKLLVRSDLLDCWLDESFRATNREDRS